MMSTLATEHLLCTEHQQTLLEVACRSTSFALESRPPFQPMVDSYAIPLRRQQSSFVRLRNHGKTVGCAGTLQSKVPLVLDVNHNAYDAACHGIEVDGDSEFTVEVFIVSPLQSLPACSRAPSQVLRSLEPGKHGVLLQYQGQDTTFTPDKWENWPDRVEFMRQLRSQLGLAADDWPTSMEIFLYSLQQLPEVRIPRPIALGRSKPK